MTNDDKPFNLIDGATGEATAVAREVNQQRKISANPELPLEERLEAYEDIFDSEVGDTTLVRARNIERAGRLAPDLLEIRRGQSYRYPKGSYRFRPGHGCPAPGV